MKIEKSQQTLFRNKIQQNSIVDRVKLLALSKGCDIKFPALSCDVVDLSPEAKVEQHAKRIFSRVQKFDIEYYDSLSPLEKSVLRKASSSCKVAAEDSLKVGLKVKEKLDKYYGEDNYVFCGIGTSPSGIGRVLEFSGAEVKYLPISRLNWLDSVNDWAKYQEKFPRYTEFLKEQGLSRQEVSKSGKKYLFYDFVQQGMSLIVFEKMMKEYFGLDLPNVSFNNLNYLCQSACAKNIDPPQYSIDYIEKYMNEGGIENLGGIPHLDIAEIEKIDECKNYENLQSKMFNFMIIDGLAKKGLLQENPLNEMSL